jgi:hypothetical protein
MTSTMRFDKWENSLGQPYGTVLQVITTTKTDTFSSSSLSYIDITGLAATITPKFASSKIMVFYSVMLGQQTTGFPMLRLNRAGTAINIGDAAGSRDRVSLMSWSGGGTNYSNTPAGMFLDSPNTTSSTVYKLQIRETSGSTIYVNRNARDDNADYEPRGVSTITLMEIAQ